MARSQRSGFNGFVEVDRAGRMKFVAVLLLVGAVFAFLMSAYYRGGGSVGVKHPTRAGPLPANFEATPGASLDPEEDVPDWVYLRGPGHVPDKVTAHA